MKVLCFILFAIMIVLSMFGNVVHAGNKQEGERCTTYKECADGLTCGRAGHHPHAPWICKRS